MNAPRIVRAFFCTPNAIIMTIKNQRIYFCTKYIFRGLPTYNREYLYFQVFGAKF